MVSLANLEIDTKSKEDKKESRKEYE